MKRTLLFWTALFGALFIYWWAFPPREPIDRANGIYANPCCGSFSLRNGTLKAGSLEVPYVVEHDKDGRPIVMPQIYVGVLNGRGIGTSKSRAPLGLVLDEAAWTPTIRLFGDDDREYKFESQSPN